MYILRTAKKTNTQVPTAPTNYQVRTAKTVTMDSRQKVMPMKVSSLTTVDPAMQMTVKKTTTTMMAKEKVAKSEM